MVSQPGRHPGPLLPDDALALARRCTGKGLPCCDVWHFRSLASAFRNQHGEGKTVFPSQFDYYRPSSLQEAIGLLGANPDAKVLAGGHSLLPAMKLRLAMPGALVDLSHIQELRGINVNGGVTIGAMTTYDEIEASPELQQRVPMLAEAAAVVGDPHVRARGTIGGSLAHSDPAADLTAVFLALGGEVTAVGSNGERIIGADDLFVDLLTTSLQPDEVITQIKIPLTGRTAMAYEKQEHPASGYAIVGVAAVLTLRDGDHCESARLAVTGCTSKATRLTAAEDALSGQSLNEETITRAAQAASEGLEVNGDLYASEEYRRHLVTVITGRTLRRATGAITR